MHAGGSCCARLCWLQPGKGSSSTHLLHEEHQAEVGSILQHQHANEGSAVGGVLCSENAAGQDAVRKEGLHSLLMVAVCQQVGLPVSEEPDAGCHAVMHLHLLLFQELDLILQFAESKNNKHYRPADAGHLLCVS